MFEGQSWATPFKCQRAEGQDIHRLLWKFTFVKLHLPLLSGLKPEAMVLPAMCAQLLAGPQA